MKPLLIIVFIFTCTIAIAQKVPGSQELKQPVLRVSWSERHSHSGIPVWNRLTKLYFIDSLSGQKIDDSIAEILSYDLIIYNENNDNDSTLVHIVNTGFAKNYSAVVRKMIPKTFVVIENIQCRIKWMGPNVFFYHSKGNEKLVFRNL